MRKPLILLAFVALCIGTPLYGQGEPPRPNLPRGADANDWEAYFDEGERRFQDLPVQARDYFYWASRLDPARAEPYFARWATFYAHAHGGWFEYLEGNREFLARPEVIANDSLVTRALQRNPFVHRGLEAALFAMMGRRLVWDGAIRAFMDYGEGDFADAAQRFGRMVRSNPGRNVRFRHWRALSFVGAGQLDSAAVEIEALLTVLRAADEQYVAYQYESKAMYEYALGMLHEVRGLPAEARRAYERALEEDLAMFPARAALGRLSLRERNTAEAAEHLAQVVEIAPNDGVMHYEYGNALLLASRFDEAVAAYQRAVQLEPHYADPYLRLGIALENAGKPAEAEAAYRAYLERAPRRQATEIQRATQRLAALGQGG